MEADEYRRMAAVEDEMWFYRALHGHLERELAARLGGCSAQILDAGCGTGGLIRRMSPRHAQWTWRGVDVEPLACELARERCGADVIEASVNALPFPAQTFDALVAADVLYHLNDDVEALVECHRVLKTGGCIIVNVPAHRWLWSYHDVTVHGKRRYERAELRQKLEDVGFEQVQSTHWNTLPLPLVWARRKLLPPPASGSDVRLYPRPVEAALRGAMALERAAIGAGWRLPVGSSILATAVKS